ncbi:hypothetical protein FRB95_012825 [Tulasnella sp. JGI-2019a]|nr:hypothetical protein FRB95_012825 [Tulasnella sp. JGI-2019a]
MPGSRKYHFTRSTRLEVLQELYAAFWGPYQDLFLPQSSGPLTGLLSDAQKAAYPNADADEAPNPGKPCGRIFNKGDSCYRCRDCAIDDSCVLCSQCFHASDHTGHNVTFYVAVQPGGVCDCGEQEAWKYVMSCRLHPPLEPNVQGTPKVNPNRSAAIVDQWAIRNRATVPHELRDFMSRTVAYGLDFVLDTLDFSPTETSTPQTEADLKKLPTADPLGNDLFSVVVWNDEKHSFDEGWQHLHDSIGCTSDEALDLTKRLDSEGRAVVEVSSNMSRLLSVSRQIQGVDMGVTVRRAYDTFREEVSAVIIEWLMDLMQCRLLNDTIILREVVAAEVYSPRKKDSSSLTSNQEATKVLAEIKDAARLDWLFLYHTRLWKRVRLNLKRVIVSMLTINHEHRLTVAVHFATVYHRIIDTYLLIDREAETSIKYLSVQIFTVPSVAAYIVRHNNIITRLLAIITSFFTNGIQNKRITFPPDPTRRVDVDSYPFRSKRFMPVFSDLRYLCTNRTIQELIAANHDHITQFIAVCQIFMGINSNKRAASSHVEYETESWISVFNVTLSLSRVVKVYGEAFALSTSSNLLYAITAVLHAILSTCTLSNDQLDKAKYSPITFFTVEFGDAEYQIIQFDVLAQWVSFHHSLHWLLAELFKHVHLLSDEPLAEVGMKSLREVVLRNASERAVLTVIDFPLRVLTMVAQIRTGLWVRNGFAIRGQLLHYRDFMLRELCYDQDLFILQTAFVILDPNLVMVTILTRFQLVLWFSGHTPHPNYEGSQLLSMVEEFLYVIITCVSEFANARHLTPLENVRRELLHGLALGPCSFTELCKRVAERIIDDIHLDKALSSVADYKPPTGTTDYGVYELKDEVFDEVNPFFYHYTRNRREEVENILKARITKKTGNSNPIIVPKPLGVEFGPFTALPLVFHSDVLLQIVFYALANILVQADSPAGVAPSSDAVMDQAVHLIMLGLVEQPDAFTYLALNTAFGDDHLTLVDIMCIAEQHEDFRASKPKIQWCLEEMTKIKPQEVRERRPKAAEDGTSAVAEEEAKKKAAKARQAKIMQQFAAQQKTFFDQYEDDEEDTEMESDRASTPSQEKADPLGPCIVCQDELDHNRAFGVLGFIQPSRLVKVISEPRIELFREILVGPSSLDRFVAPPTPADGPRQPTPDDGVGPFGVTPSDETRFGLYASVCGHLMHLECFAVYSASVEQRHLQQPTRNHPESVERTEFLCPLCKSLGNIILPVIPPPQPLKTPTPSFAEWMRRTNIELLAIEPERQRAALQQPNGSGEWVFWTAEDSEYPHYVHSSQAPLSGDWAHHILETVENIVRPLSSQTLHLRERTDPPRGRRGKGMYMPEELVGYTIDAIEIAQRGSGQAGSTVADNANESTIMRLIRGLISCMAKRAALEFEHANDGGKKVIRQGILRRLLSDDAQGSANVAPILLRDPFTLLIETAAVAPEMLHHVAILAYYVRLAQVAVTLVDLLAEVKTIDGIEDVSQSQDHAHVFGENIGVFALSVCRHYPELERNAGKVLRIWGENRFQRLLYAHTLPFLRKTLLLTRAMLPPLAVTTPNPSLPEYHRLLHLLNIPALADIALPQQESLRTALSSWCKHFGVRYSLSLDTILPQLDLPSVHQLARFPAILDSIIASNPSTLICQRCETIPNDPAICLICGTVCCHQSHCCVDVDDRKQGECNMHTRECGGAVGMYFLVKRCMVLYLYAGSGSFLQPPYLDVHGEFDYMMRRGRRQYLHQHRFDDVRKTWLNHGIPTLVARKLDGIIDSGGWDSV